jgi:hypothetical protein
VPGGGVWLAGRNPFRFSGLSNHGLGIQVLGHFITPEVLLPITAMDAPAQLFRSRPLLIVEDAPRASEISCLDVPAGFNGRGAA